MSASSNHTKAFVQCCHGKHTVASSRTLLCRSCHEQFQGHMLRKYRYSMRIQSDDRRVKDCDVGIPRRQWTRWHECGNPANANAKHFRPTACLIWRYVHPQNGNQKGTVSVHYNSVSINIRVTPYTKCTCDTYRKYNGGAKQNLTFMWPCIVYVFF